MGNTEPEGSRCGTEGNRNIKPVMIDDRGPARFGIDCCYPFGQFGNADLRGAALDHNPDLVTIELVSFGYLPMEGHRTVSFKRCAEPES